MATQTMIGVLPLETGTAPIHKLGTEFLDINGTKWVYVKADTNAKTAYKVYLLTDAYLLTTAVDNATLTGKVFKLGVPQVAFAASAYGWVAVRGKFKVNVLASAVADVPLYTSATAGSLDDDSTSQTKLVGLKVITTVGGAAADSDVLAAVDLYCG